MKTFEQFIQIYKTKGYLDMGTTIRRPSKPQNDAQLKRAYEQYVHKMNVRAEKLKAKREAPPSKDSQLSLFVRQRDKGKCRLLAVLTPSELSEWKLHHGGQGKTIDAAHVFGKGAYPHMRFDNDNIVCLNRFSHSALDTQHSPIDGHLISREEHESWWRRIVGNEKYEELLERSRSR